MTFGNVCPGHMTQPIGAAGHQLVGGEVSRTVLRSSQVPCPGAQRFHFQKDMPASQGAERGEREPIWESVHAGQPVAPHAACGCGPAHSPTCTQAALC